MPDTKPIRQGEELNAENLQAFLRENLDVKTGEIEISQFPAGNSNLTYCIKIGDQEYVLRRPPFGNQVKSAHDMAREFNVLRDFPKFTNLRRNLCFTRMMNQLSARNFI